MGRVPMLHQLLLKLWETVVLARVNEVGVRVQPVPVVQCGLVGPAIHPTNLVIEVHQQQSLITHLVEEWLVGTAAIWLSAGDRPYDVLLHAVLSA